MQLAWGHRPEEARSTVRPSLLVGFQFANATTGNRGNPDLA
jgi:hypothetical protein